MQIKVVAVKLQGRLGNQMFQHAFAFSLSRRNKVLTFIDNAGTEDIFLRYFKPLRFWERKLPRRLLQYYFGNQKRTVLFQFGHEDVNEMLADVKHYNYYDGYFQSSSYFSNISSDLKKKLQIRKEYRKRFDDKYSGIFKSSRILAIHCRLGDYVSFGNDDLGGVNLVLPESYYSNALSKIEDLDSYKVIIVTDDIEEMKNRLPELKNKLVVSEEDIIDFQILLHADKLIISNSSFSWWPAFLNQNNAEIFAPKFWLGFKVKKEYPLGIMHSTFTPVDF